MNIQNKTILRLPILLLMLLASMAEATLMSDLDVNGLTRRSDIIAVGSITEIKTFDNGTDVWTLVTMQPESSLKGGDGYIRFRIPGGTFTRNGKLMLTQVEGVPHLNVTQQGVFFLSGKSPEYLSLVGLGQGFWPVQIRNGKRMVSRSYGSPKESDLENLLREIKAVQKEEISR